MNTWRVIIQQDCKPSWNMAVDHAILDAVSEGIAPPTLRFYRWDRDAVTLGRNQMMQNGVNVSECYQRHIPVIRRITGGRGILHGGDQGITICMRPEESWSRSIASNYSALAEVFNTALRNIGLETQQGYPERRQHHVADCFALRSEADILCTNGEKILGCAQRRMKHAILEQCSLRHLPQTNSSSVIFLGDVAESEFPLKEMDEMDMIQSIVDAFSDKLHILFNENDLTMWELERACFVLKDYTPLNPMLDVIS